MRRALHSWLHAEAVRPDSANTLRGLPQAQCSVALYFGAAIFDLLLIGGGQRPGSVYALFGLRLFYLVGTSQFFLRFLFVVLSAQSLAIPEWVA